MNKLNSIKLVLDINCTHTNILQNVCIQFLQFHFRLLKKMLNLANTKSVR
jgi:hypothetical protein